MAFTPKDPVNPGAPNNLTEKTEGQAGIPNNPTEKASASPGIPNNPTEKVAQSPAIPNNPTEKAAESPVAPRGLTEESATTPAIPNSPLAKSAALIPRTLTPLVCLNFAANAYAQAGIPKVFADLFTYSRNSSATFINRRINRLGRYEYFLDTDYVGNVENLVTYSEQFDNADWVKVGSSVTGNKLIENTATSEHRLDQSGVATTDNTFTVIAKYAGRELHLRLGSTDGAYFDLRTGTIISEQGSGVPSISYEGDGYFKCSVFVPAPSNNIARISVTQGTVGSYEGDGVSGVILKNSQLTESAKPLPYVKTLSVAVTETFSESFRRAYDPITGEPLGVLIEGNNTNLCLRSEEFGTTWGNSNITLEENSTIAPDRTKSADKLIATSVDSSHQLFQAVDISENETATFSVYARSAGYTWMRIGITDNTAVTRSVWFNLGNGTVGTTDAAITAKIVPVQDGWFRCSASLDYGAGADTNLHRVAPATQDAETNFLGDDASGIHVWGAQVEEHPYATSYIRTEGSTVSRSADDLSLPEAGNYVMSGDMTTYCLAHLTDVPNGGADDARFFYQTEAVNADYSGLRISLSGSLFTKHGSASRTIKSDGAFGEGDLNLAFAYDSASNVVTSYFDGENVDSGSAGTLFQGDPSGAIRIGKPNASAQWLYGYLKELRFYDVKLTDQEVSLL